MKVLDWKDYKIPESLSAFESIVSLTAANTSRIFVVSVACVKLKGNYISKSQIGDRRYRTEGIHLISHGWLA